MKIKITSDSTCDLSQELIEKYDIGIVPLYIVKDDVTYKDGLEISRDDIFAHVAAGGALCSTAAVNTGDYLDFFTPLLQEYDAIIHFCISSEMSSCYQNACLAAAELGNIYPIDARSLSTGIGHLVIDAAIMAAEGVAPAEIKETLDKRKEKLDVSFVLNTLDYMVKGGRCSAVAAFGANVLGLKICIEVKDGKMGVAKKYRGSFEKTLVKYIQERLGDIETVDTRRIFITDSGVSDEIWQATENAVRAAADFDEIHHTAAGCTICSHCGPNCLGILFYRK